MLSKVGSIILKRFKYSNYKQIYCFRKTCLRIGQFFLCRYNSSQSVSYEDVRVQKHLKTMIDLISNFKENELHKEGYDPRILNQIFSLASEIKRIESELEELKAFISDLETQKDELLNTALSEQKTLENVLQELKNEVMQLIVPNEIFDDKDIIMELSAGVGGQEAMLFAKDMFDMYIRFAQWKGWEYELLKYDRSDLGGIRSAHIGINGENAYKTLKYECGVHRVQRVPKTERSGRIHTSTMTVAVLPQPSEIDIVISPNDIEMEFKRSSGAGGQHVNTTDSCVRIHHKPTGIVTESQMERNQHKNRELAMKSLRAKLYERELEALMKETTFARKSQVGSAARSEKVRTYNFPQDRITDHRAHMTIYDIETFFRGEDNLNNLLQRLQEWNRTQSLIEILNKYDST